MSVPVQINSDYLNDDVTKYKWQYRWQYRWQYCKLMCEQFKSVLLSLEKIANLLIWSN